jgi:GT2 family glycosyltransferase/lipopolysaccharide biosynthesis regulator YciM
MRKTSSNSKSVAAKTSSVHPNGLLHRKRTRKIKAYIADAEIAMAKEDWSEAVKRWEEVLEHVGKRELPEAWIKLSRANRYNSNYNDAEAAVKRGMRKMPDHLGLRLEYAEIAMAKEDWSEAVKRWEEVLEHVGKRELPEAWIKLSRANRYNSNYNDAEAAVKRGMRKMPDHLGLRLEYAEIAMAKEDWSEAVKRWEEVLEHVGKRELPEAWIKLSRANRYNSNYNDAEAAVKRGMRKMPDHLGLRLEYAEIAMAKEDWSEAVKRWEEVLRLENNEHALTQQSKAQACLESEAERNLLLENVQPDEVIVNVTSKKLKQLDYPVLVKELRTINESCIDWNVHSNRKLSDELISVIVLVFNNIELTTRCIESIYTAETNAKFELLVFNNGSDSATIKGLRKLNKKYADMKLIHSAQNLNFAVGNNVAFSYAKGTHCIFLNNDTFVSDYWIDGLIAAFQDKDILAAQPTLLYPDDSIQCMGVVFSKKSPIGYPLYAGLPKVPNLMKSRRLRAITAACLAIRTENFAALRGFSPRYINGQEDVDLCLRLLEMSPGACFCTKESLVYHDEGKSVGRGKYVFQNRKAFIETWGDKVTADDEIYYKKDGFKVSSWKLDSPKLLANGVASYRPRLIKNVSVNPRDSAA